MIMSKLKGFFQVLTVVGVCMVKCMGRPSMIRGVHLALAD